MFNKKVKQPTPEQIKVMQEKIQRVSKQINEILQKEGLTTRIDHVVNLYPIE